MNVGPYGAGAASKQPAIVVKHHNRLTQLPEKPNEFRNALPEHVPLKRYRLSEGYMLQHIDLARISLLQAFPFEANARQQGQA